jgi:hypothetical protein
MSEPRPDAVQRFFGGALIAVGALIFCLCGLCTAGFLVASLLPHADRSFAIMALVIGGIPTAIGFGMMQLGHAMHRGPQAVAAPPGDGEAPKPPPSSAPPPG